MYSRFVPAGTKVKGIQSKRIVFDEDGVAREEELTEQQESDGECDEKMDTSVEESFEEVDELGNKRKVIIKRSIEPINNFRGMKTLAGWNLGK